MPAYYLEAITITLGLILVPAIIFFFMLIGAKFPKSEREQAGVGYVDMLKELGVALDPRGNVLANTKEYRASLDKVFAAGDMRRGQSLVVWAIREGRQAARAVDEFLMGSSVLPR